jgi:hypothetical protein
MLQRSEGSGFLTHEFRKHGMHKLAEFGSITSPMEKGAQTVNAQQVYEGMIQY